MADFNEIIRDLQKKSSKTKKDLELLLSGYEDLLHEINAIYMEERMSVMASNIEGQSEDELLDFYRLIQVIKRNRDIIGSTLRGFSGIRSTKEFRFIEEDATAAELSEKKKAKTKISKDPIESVIENILTEDIFKNQKIVDNGGEI